MNPVRKSMENLLCFSKVRSEKVCESFNIKEEKFSNGVKNKLFLLSILLIFLYGSISVGAKDSGSEETEKLIFSLRWMGVVGGKSTIEIKKTHLDNSTENSYLLDAELRTVGFADMLFRIRDEFSSLAACSLQQVAPVWWQVTLKEKNYDYKEKTEFSELLKKTPDLQSPLSALCLIRLKNWKIGEEIIVPVLSRKKISNVKVKAVSKEDLKIYNKNFDTVLLDISVEGKGVEISSTKLKDLKIWLTDDDKKLPVFMKAETSAGVVTVLLDNRKEFYK